MIHFIVRHWRGELRPGVTWWINCVVLTVLLWWAVPRVAFGAGLLPPDTSGRFLAMLALQIFQIGLVPLWQMVGLWRSGARAVRENSGWLVAYTTQVTAFLFTILIIMRGLVFGAEQVISARVSLALGPYHYQVTLLPSGREIAVDGGLGFGVSDAVKTLLDANPQVRRIRLESGGGALWEGVKLREIIMARNLDTYTARECSSACVSAYAGGRFRYLQRGARIGVHLPRNWETFSSNPVSAPYRAELIFFRNRGLPDWFLGNWVRAGQRFWYPTEFQLVSSGLVTHLRGVPPREA
ncbi:MAG: hypothetical protein OEV14_00860 [Gammaproteobacteria bacterium]|nr:hypothetical protein [Gammaproteobacteria bacterium]